MTPRLSGSKGTRARAAKAGPSAYELDVIKLGHIDSRQLTLMILFLLATKIFLMFPSFVTLRAGTAAWISVLISASIAAFGLWGWLLWTRSTGNLGIIPSLRLTLGRVLGDIAGLFLVVYFVLTTSLSVRTFSGGAIIGLLQEFPLEILIGIVIVAAMYAAWLGLEAVGRAATFFFPLIVVSILLVALGAYRLFDIRHLYPLLGLGTGVVLKEGLTHTGLFASLSAVAVLKSYVREPRDLGRSSFKGLCLATVFMVASVIVVASMFPYPESTRQVIPLGIVARAVYLGRFLQRIEALFTFTWFFASAVHASVSYMMTLLLLSQLMNTHTYRPIVPAVASLTFGIAANPGSILEAGRLLDSVHVTAGNIEVALGWLLFLIGKLCNVSDKAARVSRQLDRLKEDPSYSEDYTGAKSVDLQRRESDTETPNQRTQVNAETGEGPNGINEGNRGGGPSN